MYMAYVTWTNRVYEVYEWEYSDRPRIGNG